MEFLFVFVLSLVFIFQAVDVAMALPFRAPLPPLEAPRVLALEMGFHSLFTTAVLFSIIGAFLMRVMSRRTPAFMIRLPRVATIHEAISRLPSLLLALDSRVAPRRIPMRRGRVSAPMATVPRNRWAPRPTRPRLL